MKNLSWQAVVVVALGLGLAGYLASIGNEAAVVFVITNVLTLFSKPLPLKSDETNSNS